MYAQELPEAHEEISRLAETLRRAPRHIEAPPPALVSQVREWQAVVTQVAAVIRAADSVIEGLFATAEEADEIGRRTVLDLTEADASEGIDFAGAPRGRRMAPVRTQEAL